MRRTRLMRPSAMMARVRVSVGLAGLLFAMLATPLSAQTAAAPGAFAYDVRDEITIQGTVSSVQPRPSTGMVAGSHLLLATPSGPVDASLGRFGLYGKGAVSVAAGQQVEVTGVVKTIGNQQIFLARTVRIGDQVYAIRNQHGVSISPQARAAEAVRKGGGQ